MAQAGDIEQLLLIAGAAALASPLGGWLGLQFRAGTLFLSIAVGLAGGVLLGTCAFDMLPSARDNAGLLFGMAGFVAGFLIVYGFDLYINRGFLAGRESDEWRRYSRLRRNRRARTSDAILLAGSTAAEEIIEGLSIGIGLAADPRLGLAVGMAILLDNVIEGMGIAELIRAEQGGQTARTARLVYRWTGLVGISLFVSALAGWLLLHDIGAAALGTLVAGGAGAMFYLTITDLLPKSERIHYFQSAAMAAASGFLVSFALSGW